MKMPSTYNGLVNTAKDMNTDVVTAFSILSSNETTDRFRKLSTSITNPQFFEFEGVIYKGNKSLAIIKFIIDNPGPSDFAVWLDNNYVQYCPVS